MTSSSSGSRVRPYLVTSADAARLPRWIPLLFCAVYVLAGLFGRDPWRTDDAIGFGIAHTMATGNSIDWLLPNVQGQLVPDEGGPHGSSTRCWPASSAMRPMAGASPRTWPCG